MRPFARRDLTLALLLLGTLGAFAAHVDRRASVELHGVARIVDGDTVVIDGRRIRLAGIDAPELGQMCEPPVGAAYDCGAAARDALERLADGAQMACASTRKDRYGRYVANCVAGGTDLNAAMVEAGWAVASGAHGRLEASAREAGRGVWAGRFDDPRAWRAERGMAGDDGGFVEWMTDRWRLYLDRS